MPGRKTTRPFDGAAGEHARWSGVHEWTHEPWHTHCNDASVASGESVVQFAMENRALHSKLVVSTRCRL